MRAAGVFSKAGAPVRVVPDQRLAELCALEASLSRSAHSRPDHLAEQRFGGLTVDGKRWRWSRKK
jgi:hypothetical protein